MNQSTEKVQNLDRGERLAEERRRLGLSQPAFADLGGVKKGSQLLYEKGNAPTADYLARIASAGADVLYILTGQGNRSGAFQEALNASIQGSQAEFQAATDAEVGTTRTDKYDMVKIPAYEDVRPSAGAGAYPVSESSRTHISFEKHWLLDIGVQPSAAVILSAQGDSMEPTIMNGAPMLVDMSKTDVRNGYIYVIAVGHDLLVKRVRRRLDGLIDLISDNTAYATETLAEGELPRLRVVGRVYATVSRF